MKAHKGIGPKEDLLDRAGLAELGANALRIGLTDNKLRSGQIKGEENAISSHHQAGKEIRAAIERLGGPPPEDLPAEPSIKSLTRERQTNCKKLAAHKDQTQLDLFDQSSQSIPDTKEENSSTTAPGTKLQETD